MPPTRSPRATTPALRPRCSSRASAPGLTVSPHNLSRGKTARSTIRTRTPACASTAPATLPAGPAPTIRTSTSMSVDWVIGELGNWVIQLRIAARGLRLAACGVELTEAGDALVGPQHTIRALRAQRLPQYPDSP